MIDPNDFFQGQLDKLSTYDSVSYVLLGLSKF
jgi:hypothetical protein